MRTLANSWLETSSRRFCEKKILSMTDIETHLSAWIILSHLCIRLPASPYSPPKIINYTDSNWYGLRLPSKIPLQSKFTWLITI